MAQGVLMERYGINPQQSFSVLRRYSQNHNEKLHAVAAWVVDNRKRSVHEFPDDVAAQGIVSA